MIRMVRMQILLEEEFYFVFDTMKTDLNELKHDYMHTYRKYCIVILMYS